MVAKWHVAFQDLQRRRSELIDELRKVPAGQLARRPSPDAWSLVQVVEHFMLVERAMIEDAKKRLAGPRQAVTPRETILHLVVLWTLNSGVRIKTPPAARGVIPQPETTLDWVDEQWSATRNELALLLEELPPERHRSAVFRHPVSGGMTPGQGLAFLETHIRHHRSQLKRLLHFRSSPS